MKRLSPFPLVLILVLVSASYACAQRIYVESAYYGAKNRYVDVTRQVQQFAHYGRPFLVSNSTFRTDPSPGRRKTLTVVYYVRGQRTSARVPEGQRFYFRRSSGYDHGRPPYYYRERSETISHDLWP